MCTVTLFTPKHAYTLTNVTASRTFTRSSLWRRYTRREREYILTTSRIRIRPTQSVDVLIAARRATLNADHRIYMHSAEGASRSYAFRDLLFDGLRRVARGAEIPPIDESESRGASLSVRLPTRHLACVTDIAADAQTSTNTMLARLVTLGGQS